jgi:phosphatidylglycerophosphate synthase
MGSFLDPMADKVLIATLFLSLTYMNLIPGKHMRDKFTLLCIADSIISAMSLLQSSSQVRSLPGTCVLSRLPSMCATSLSLHLLVHIILQCCSKNDVCMRGRSKFIKCFLIPEDTEPVL